MKRRWGHFLDSSNPFAVTRTEGQPIYDRAVAEDRVWALGNGRCVNGVDLTCNMTAVQTTLNISFVCARARVCVCVCALVAFLSLGQGAGDMALISGRYKIIIGKQNVTL